jgi:ATP phosphoribosyltransferase
VLRGDELRIALPSKGRLNESSVALLQQAGLSFRVSGRRLFAVCTQTGTRIIFSNTQDIPVLVSEGAVDLGITGSDQVLEKGVEVIEHARLGFGRCRLAVAAHQDAALDSPDDLAGKVVGSSFPNLARRYFEERGVADVHVLAIQGAVEVMVLLGLVDAIVEIVETGSSLLANDLVELWPVIEAEAVLIGRAEPRGTQERDRLLRGIEGVLAASRYSVLDYNCPSDRIEDAVGVTPGFSSPTIQTLRDPGWFAVKVLVEKDRVYRVIEELDELGCTAILESELRHARL